MQRITAEPFDDEPVIGQPPTSLLDGLDLPGPDPARIDVPRLHQLIRQRRNPAQYAATALDTCTEVIRYALDEHSAPAPRPSPSERDEGDARPASTWTSTSP
ncbi:hypothetical protein [Streptomyces sp. NPDC052107]|uniref:hypothetical protein n=1 Tax=Streptomyces sp. NPDC052107 TaxID=3155632 RepID=UPI00343C19BB